VLIRLSDNFSLEELVVTSQRGPDGELLPNVPGLEELHNLRALARTLLEPIREMWGCPVRVTSGYRSHDVEMKVSGKDYGQHRLGQAADIIPLGNISAVEAFERIVLSVLPYDQAIIEQNKAGARWIHVSYTDLRAPRRMALYSPDGHTYALYAAGAFERAVA
jgi:zinc D-Ala-D-Ala carboxypeptidase